jgi:hypothetical protein
VQGQNQPPAISIQSPANNSKLSGPRNLVITVNATDSDGSVTKVDFFNGRVYLGQSATPPFTFTLPNAAVGNYTLLARATDNLGATTTSAGSHVTLQTGGSGGPALLISPTSTSDTFVFSVRTEANQSYVVETASSLNAPNWTAAGSFSGTGSDVPVSRPLTQGMQYFRVRTE